VRRCPIEGGRDGELRNLELGDVVLQSAITLRGAAPGLNPVDVKFIDDALKELLAS
jgi:hypothetical protein